MALSPEFLAVLRCPESKDELIYFPEGEGNQAGAFLFCPTSRLRYRIEEPDLPIMLIEEAERVSEDETRRLVARARELGLDVPASA
jgi:uncharacterized protein YbaR (Trm112 family)